MRLGSNALKRELFEEGPLVNPQPRTFETSKVAWSIRSVNESNRRSYTIQQTAPLDDYPSGKFRVIHPFHPLHEQQLDEVGRTRQWGDERVWFRTASGDLRTIPLRFTSLAGPDPYRQWGGGRSWHRIAELVELRRLLDRLRDPEAP